MTLQDHYHVTPPVLAGGSLTSYESLANKVVVVTGASSGLGAALVREFAENNCTVYGLARNEAKLKSVFDELKSKNPHVWPIHADVSDCLQVDFAARNVVQNESRIDVWVNNAGCDFKANIFEMSYAMMRRIVDVNLLGLMYGTHAAAKHMRKQQYGDIVQILSTSAFTPRPDEPAYCGSKSGAEAWSDSVRPTLQKENIRVIKVYPGGMDTEFAGKAGLTAPPNLMSPDFVAHETVRLVTLPRSVVPELRLYRA